MWAPRACPFHGRYFSMIILRCRPRDWRRIQHSMQRHCSSFWELTSHRKDQKLLPFRRSSRHWDWLWTPKTPRKRQCVGDILRKGLPNCLTPWRRFCPMTKSARRRWSNYMAELFGFARSFLDENWMQPPGHCLGFRESLSRELLWRINSGGRWLTWRTTWWKAPRCPSIETWTRLG